MGISKLWTDLRQAGLVSDLNGKEHEVEIAREVDNLSIAVDVSIWMFQASMQPDLAGVFHSPIARILKVCFDRCIQWLRFGCVPVAVLEGDSPLQKQAEIQRRFEARGLGQSYVQNETGERGQYLTTLNQYIANLFKALGLPVVQAPGEAEAMCAALQRRGIVSACATKDSDALIFGATKVLHTINLQVRPAKANALQICELDNVREWLGISAGGTNSLLLIALLVGGDYHQGAEKVGLRTAFSAVKHLLRNKEDDDGLVEILERQLQLLTKDEASDLPTKCTGCRRCGHEGGRKNTIKQHTRKNLCTCCPPPLDEDAEEGIFCQLKAGNQPCQCRFHSLTAERGFSKLLQKLSASPDFLAEAKEAQSAYAQQMELADTAVSRWISENGVSEGQKLSWICRPNAVKVRVAVTAFGRGLPWDLHKVEKKLHLLLREWDASNPRPEAEFRPTKVLKVAGSAPRTDIVNGWAYLVDWEKNGKADDESSDLEAEATDPSLPQEEQQLLSQPSGSMSPAPSRGQTPGGIVNSVSRATKQKDLNAQGRRYLRMSVVKKHWPSLVSEFEGKIAQKKSSEADKAARRAEKARAKEVRASYLSGHKQTTLDVFFTQRKQAAAPQIKATGRRLVSAPSDQDPAISSDDSEETVSDPPRSGRSKATAAPRASTAAKARQQAKPSAKKTLAGIGAVIVIDDSPPSTQQPSSLAQEVREPATRNVAKPSSRAPAESAQLAEPSTKLSCQDRLPVRGDEAGAAKPLTRESDKIQRQHHGTSSLPVRDAAQQREIKSQHKAKLEARAHEPAERHQHNARAAAVGKGESRRDPEANAAPVFKTTAELPGSVYASPSSSLPGEGEEATAAAPDSSRCIESREERPGLCNRAEPAGGTDLGGGLAGADGLGEYDGQVLETEMEGPGLSNSWGYGGISPGPSLSFDEASRPHGADSTADSRPSDNLQESDTVAQPTEASNADNGDANLVKSPEKRGRSALPDRCTLQGKASPSKKLRTPEKEPESKHPDDSKFVTPASGSSFELLLSPDSNKSVRTPGGVILPDAPRQDSSLLSRRLTFGTSEPGSNIDMAAGHTVLKKAGKSLLSGEAHETFNLKQEDRQTRSWRQQELAQMSPECIDLTQNDSE